MTFLFKRQNVMSLNRIKQLCFWIQCTFFLPRTEVSKELIFCIESIFLEPTLFLFSFLKTMNVLLSQF